MSTRIRLLSILCFVGALTTACAGVPPELSVDQGNIPANADKVVRFRTTYYFRVFDACRDTLTGRPTQPETDTLFRFVMTGKANSLANQVRFESGTLTAAQIDPFGASVNCDASEMTCRFISSEESRQISRATVAKSQINDLLELRRNLDQASSDEALTALDPHVQTAISEIIKKNYTGEYNLPTGASNTNVSPNCPAGSELRRGFQIMGPQGIKTFDQDERLLMAMGSSAAPLISTLTELSDRYLKTEESKLSGSDLELNLLREQIRVIRMDKAKLAASDTSEGLADYFCEVWDGLADGDAGASSSCPDLDAGKEEEDEVPA